MDQNFIREILQKVQEKDISLSKAMEELSELHYKDIGIAKLDTHRSLRRGFPEAVLCKGKTLSQIKHIALHLPSKGYYIFTKMKKGIYKKITSVRNDMKFYPEANLALLGQPAPKKKNASKNKNILVISAGTSDMQVAEEAAITVEIMGGMVERIYDVGVAGLNRLIHHLKMIRQAKCIIVVAGMDGALPSVVSGLASAPVLAVPTSNGYGASFKGISSLLSMLNSCSPGVAVFNIDNGYGSGYFAANMLFHQ